MRRSEASTQKIGLFLLVPLIIVALASLCSCRKAASPPPEPESTAVSTPSPVAAATPVEENHHAPPGVFFLLTPTSIVSYDGVTGLRPGTRLVKISEGTYIGEGLTLKLRKDQVTNDVWVAARVAGADQAAQASIRQALRSTSPKADSASIEPGKASRGITITPVQQNPLDAPSKPADPRFAPTQPRPLGRNALDAPARPAN